MASAAEKARVRWAVGCFIEPEVNMETWGCPERWVPSCPAAGPAQPGTQSHQWLWGAQAEVLGGDQFISTHGLALCARGRAVGSAMEFLNCVGELHCQPGDTQG